MEYCDKVDELSGFACENKIICSTKRALSNLFLMFKDELSEYISIDENLNSDNSFHAFLKLLDILSNLIENKKYQTSLPSLTRVDCIPNSNKFYFPKNMIALKSNNDLFIKYDDCLANEKKAIIYDLFKKFPRHNLNSYIDYDSIKLENIFGCIYFCTSKHDHKKCLDKMNKIIEQDKIIYNSFNITERGMLFFDYVIYFVKLLQLLDIELLSILYLKILKNEKIQDSTFFNEIKDKLINLNRKITILDFAYFLQLTTLNHKFLNLTNELLECHFSSKNTEIFIFENPNKQYIRIPLFD